MNAGLIQMCASSNKNLNIKNACSLIIRAINEGADFILLPEVFNYRGSVSIDKLYEIIAEDIPGDSILPLMEIAKNYKVHILAGSIYERSKNSKKVYNSSLLINNFGQIVNKYRKKNLFKAFFDGKTIDEGELFLSGKKNSIAKINDLKVGLSICYDLRFPELYREYFYNGVDVLLIPSSFTTKTGELHWETLLKARAIENYCYVLAPNQYGKDGNGVETFGHSMAINPHGKIISSLGSNEEGIVKADISKKNQNHFPIIN